MVFRAGKNWLRGLGALAVLGAFTAAAPLHAAETKFHGGDITGTETGKDFSLTDPDGKVRHLADFKGKAVLIFFGFTQCPVICPTALSRAVEIKKLLGADGARLQVLFVSVDPERDTPEILRGYTQAFDPSFLGLTTDAAHLKETAKDFKITYEKVPTGSSYTMDHSVVSYLYDPAGRIRLVLNHARTAEECAQDIAAILKDFPAAPVAAPPSPTPTEK
ncbi:MAG: hypothetical protein JWO82_3435 [Akkermansiaceae bacterium]|nr:hypothetical protein [Akkermansiaceae bacterium]